MGGSEVSRLWQWLQLDCYDSICREEGGPVGIITPWRNVIITSWSKRVIGRLQSSVPKRECYGLIIWREALNYGEEFLAGSDLQATQLAIGAVVARPESGVYADSCQ